MKSLWPNSKALKICDTPAQISHYTIILLTRCIDNETKWERFRFK